MPTKRLNAAEKEKAHTVLLPPDRRDETALGQARRLLGKALAPIEEALEGREYLVGEFSAADVMLGHSCIMSNRLGVVTDEMPNLKAYVERLLARPDRGCGVRSLDVPTQCHAGVDDDAQRSRSSRTSASRSTDVGLL